MSMTENTAIKEIVRQSCEGCYGLDDSEVGMCKKCGYQMAIQALEEIQQYRAIGTIEEFKALKEKNEPRKPRFYAHNYHCIVCGNLVGNNEFEWQRFLYCDNCGTKIDWS